MLDDQAQREYLVNMTTDLTAQTPAEIDTELARIWGEINKVDNYIASAERTLNARWLREDDRERTWRRIDSLQAERAELFIEANPYEAEYARRGGWNRYFLVDNTNGHVHRGMHCSTCFPTTRYSWLIDLADCDENAMIEEWGEMACTVCFPSAPTNPAFNRPSRRDREAQAARQAEKLARQAAKDAKALPGGEIRVGYDIIRTKIAARNALSQAVQNLAWYGVEGGNGDRFLTDVRQLTAALEGTEIDTEKVIASALKKIAREGNAHGAEHAAKLIREIA